MLKPKTAMPKPRAHDKHRYSAVSAMLGGALSIVSLDILNRVRPLRIGILIAKALFLTIVRVAKLRK